MKTHTYRTIIERDGDSYHGYVPALPGCHTAGDTIEETRNNLREAIQGILLSMKKHGDPIPSDDSVETFETIDTEELFKRHDYA